MSSANIKRSYNTFISRLTDDLKRNFRYDTTTYQGMAKPMTIICAIHNQTFKQRPDTHLDGALKCTECIVAIKPKIQIKDYIDSLLPEISEKHVYITDEIDNMRTLIEIRCKEHNITFSQGAGLHKRGKRGCKQCIREKRAMSKASTGNKRSKQPYTIQKYVDKCNEVHGNKYDYSGVEFRTLRNRINIKCPKHGLFTPLADSHLRGNGCKKCSTEKISVLQRDTTEEFIEKANKAWNNFNQDLFDYSNTVYVGRHAPLKIICKIHNLEFTQVAGSHLLEHNGCKECKKTVIAKKNTTPVTTRIEDARKIHGDRYEYDINSYVNGKIPMKIRCPDHGWFEQKMFKHINAMQGCPVCSWSIGAKLLYTILTKHYESKLIDRFDREYTGFNIVYNNQMRCDFVVWINDRPLVIEFDHKQHFEKQNHFHQDIDFLTQKLRDVKKNLDLLRMNISILRIHWEDINYIESILVSTYRRFASSVEARIYFSQPLAYKRIWFK